MKAKTLILVLLIAAISITSVFYGCKGKGSGNITLTKDVLSIGMEINYPPMEYYTGAGKTPSGFDVELGKAIAKKLGMGVNFIDTSWDKIFSGLNENKYDCIISSVTINDARSAVHDFSKPYVSNTLTMVLTKNTKVSARSPEQCADLNVAFQAETTADEYMEDLANGGLRYTPIRHDNIIQCFSELYLGQADVIVTDLLVAYEFVAKQNSPFEIVWKSSEDEKFGVCIKKGNDALTNAINKALEELWADGTIMQISMDTFGMDLVTSAWK